MTNLIDTSLIPVNRTNQRLTKLAFVNRFPAGALPRILAMAKTEVDIEAFVKLLDWASPDPDGTSIDLADPRTREAISALRQHGLLSEQEQADLLRI